MVIISTVKACSAQAPTSLLRKYQCNIVLVPLEVSQSNTLSNTHAVTHSITLSLSLYTNIYLYLMNTQIWSHPEMQVIWIVRRCLFGCQLKYWTTWRRNLPIKNLAVLSHLASHQPLIFEYLAVALTLNDAGAINPNIWLDLPCCNLQAAQR